jgi:GLPGLI family protein
MKTNLISLIILFCLSQNIFSQNNFKAEYKLLLAKNGFAPIYYELINHDTKSIFKFVTREVPEKVVADEFGNVNLYPEIPDSIQPLILTDHKSNEIISKEYITDNDRATYKEYFVVEPISIKWNFINETKKVDKYLCRKATTSFRGRDYVVWYTDEIPISIGPWKFHRLPGLIVEITDATNEVAFILERITYPYEGEIDNCCSQNTITIKDFFTLKELAREKSSEEFMSKVLSKLPRGSTIELTEDGNYEIETKL